MLPFAGVLGTQLFHPVAPNFTDQQLWLSFAPTYSIIHLAGAERHIYKGAAASRSTRQVLTICSLGPHSELGYEEAHQASVFRQQRYWILETLEFCFFLKG